MSLGSKALSKIIQDILYVAITGITMAFHLFPKLATKLVLLQISTMIDNII